MVLEMVPDGFSVLLALTVDSEEGLAERLLRETLGSRTDADLEEWGCLSEEVRW